MVARFNQGGARGGGPRDRAAPGGTTTRPLFDPKISPADLVDKLAEEQAKAMPDNDLKSSQLRRFFNEVKDLFRQLEQGTDYETAIRPRFKMLRSKAAYAYGRSGEARQSKIPTEFRDFLDNGVQKVSTEQEFRLFVLHFEAVVGFLYGLEKVGN